MLGIINSLTRIKVNFKSNFADCTLIFFAAAELIVLYRDVSRPVVFRWSHLWPPSQYSSWLEFGVWVKGVKTWGRQGGGGKQGRGYSVMGGGVTKTKPVFKNKVYH